MRLPGPDPIDPIAKMIAFYSAAIAGNPLLTGREDHWQSLSSQDQRRYRWIAGEAIGMFQKGARE